VERLLTSPSPAGRFCALATRRLREFYNEIRGGSETYGVVDSLAITSALYPEIMTKLVAAKCRIELHDAEKRGYFHFDTAAPEADHNAVLCTAVDTALFKQRMYALLGAE